MSTEPSRVLPVSRRALMKGAVALGGAAALSGSGPFILRTRAADTIKLTYMSNQRHDQAVKADLFKQFSASDAGKLNGTPIEVEMKVFADEYPDQLKLAFESGKPPDIFNMNQPRQQAAAGWAEPADDFLAQNPDLKNSFLPGAFVNNRGVYGGKTYGLPMYAQTMRLYYNKTIFSDAGLDPSHPPATFTEFRSFAKQISDKLGGEGVSGLILGDKYTWVWGMNCTNVANGAGSYGFDWKSGQYNYASDGIMQVVELLTAMKADGSVFSGIHTLTDDDARQQFSLGMAGMIIGGSWNPGVFNDQFQSTEDWETAELPIPDSGRTGRTAQGMGDRYTVSATSQNKEAAWKVLQFLYSVPTMTTMYTRGMGVMGVAAANTGQSDVRGVAKLAPTANDVITPPEPELPTITPDFPTVMQGIFDDNGTTAAQKLGEITKVYNDTMAAAVADGTLSAGDYTIATWDPMTWQGTA